LNDLDFDVRPFVMLGGRNLPVRRTVGEAASAAADFANLADAGRMDAPAARFFLFDATSSHVG